MPFYSQAVEHGPAGPPEPSRQHAAPDAAASAPGRRAEHWRGSEEGSAPPGHTCGPGEAGWGKGPSQGGPGASIGCAHRIDRRGRAGPAAEGPSPGGAGRPQPGRGPSRQETEQAEGPDATTWRHLSPLGPPPHRPDPRGLRETGPECSPHRLPTTFGRLRHPSVPRAGAPAENTVAPPGRGVPGTEQ